MNKRYIKVIIVLILLSVIFIATIGLDLIKNKDKVDLIVIENVVFEKKYISNKWSMKKEAKDIKKHDWKTLNVYLDHEYYGNYYLYFNDKWYLFDKNKHALNYNGSMIAFNNLDYKDINFTINDSNDNQYLNEILSSKKLKNNQTLSSNYYIDVDFDNDNESEKLYVSTNKFLLDGVKTNTYFSFVYYVKDNKINIIYEKIEKNSNEYDGCKPYIRNIISMPNNSYAIVLNCAEYSTNGVISKLYQYKNGKIQELK